MDNLSNSIFLSMFCNCFLRIYVGIRMLLYLYWCWPSWLFLFFLLMWSTTMIFLILSGSFDYGLFLYFDWSFCNFFGRYLLNWFRFRSRFCLCTCWPLLPWYLLNWGSRMICICNSLFLFIILHQSYISVFLNLLQGIVLLLLLIIQLFPFLCHSPYNVLVIQIWLLNF